MGIKRRESLFLAKDFRRLKKDVDSDKKQQANQSTLQSVLVFLLFKMSGLDQTRDVSVSSSKSYVVDLEACCSCHGPCPRAPHAEGCVASSQKESFLAVGLLWCFQVLSGAVKSLLQLSGCSISASIRHLHETRKLHCARMCLQGMEFCPLTENSAWHILRLSLTLVEWMLIGN